MCGHGMRCPETDKEKLLGEATQRKQKADTLFSIRLLASCYCPDPATVGRALAICFSVARGIQKCRVTPDSANFSALT
jgi:hypothetical protein